MDFQARVIRIASQDGFLWNPYAEDRLNRAAGRAKKKGRLTVWFKRSADGVWLRPTDDGMTYLRGQSGEDSK